MVAQFFNNKRQIYTYVGINPNYSLDQRDLQLTGKQAVISNFFNLMRTSPGTVWFEPEFGAGIPDILFDNATQHKEFRIANRAWEACQTWLKMVTLDKSKTKLITPQVDTFQVSFSISINQANPIDLGMVISGE